MLKDKELRAEIIWLYHNMLVARYREKWKMIELVTRNCWWLGVTKDIGKYMEGCDAYQRMKNRTKTPVGKLMTNEVLEKPQMYLTVDFIMKLPLGAGKDVILVVYNRLSKIAYFVVITEETLVEGLARLFRNNVWKLNRLPESVISNRGPQFVAELMRELNKMLGIEIRLSTAFHSQTDGQIQMEQMNQELEQYLRFFTEYRQRDWPEWLTTAEFAVNNKVHTATKVLPFIANYRRELKMGVDIRRRGKVEKVAKFAKRIKKVQEKAEAALRKAQKDIKKQADRGRQEVEE